MTAKIAKPNHPVQAVIAQRWSPYVFRDAPVAPALLCSLFEAARWAPSSMNEQPWRYIVALREDAEAFEQLLSCLVEGNQKWAHTVPVLALGVVKRRFARNGKENVTAAHDLGLASANLVLEATARGLSVHQMAGIRPDRARMLYGIPDDADALTALAIGYVGDPAGRSDDYAERDRKPRTRNPLAAFVFGARFGEAARFCDG